MDLHTTYEDLLTQLRLEPAALARADAQAGTKEAFRYLQLRAAFPEEDLLAPSAIVNSVLNTLYLFPGYYYDVCFLARGGAVPHGEGVLFASLAETGNAAASSQEKRALLESLYLAKFGAPPPTAFWPKPLPLAQAQSPSSGAVLGGTHATESSASVGEKRPRDDDVAAVARPPPRIRISIVDESFSQKVYVVQKTLLFKQVAAAYLKNIGSTKSVQFFFDGDMLAPEDYKSLEECGLQDGDRIDCKFVQSGC